jgi:GNAT superfamily N-acetyltransferase
MSIRIRVMTPADLEAATAAVLRGDWGARASWFRFATEHPACSPFVAVDGDEIIGTGVGTDYGASGWVGTIYVVPERRGQGVGLELSRVVADVLTDAGCRTLVLAATEAGRGVYERLGFAVTDEYVILEHEGPPPGSPAPPADPLVRSFSPADLDEAARLDRAATGEDRSAVLASLADASGGLAVRDGDGPLRGFLLRGPWRGGATIAADADDALRIARARVAAHAGSRVLTGLLGSNAAGLARFEAEGWIGIRRVVRMERGKPLDWRPAWIWGQLDFGLG